MKQSVNKILYKENQNLDVGKRCLRMNLKIRTARKAEKFLTFHVRQNQYHIDIFSRFDICKRTYSKVGSQSALSGGECDETEGYIQTEVKQESK